MLPSSSLVLPDHQRGITAAANAAASWVRAQRARRGEATIADVAEHAPAVEFEDEHLFGVEDRPSAAERAGAWLRSLGARVWLMSFGVILAIVALAALGSTLAAYRKSGMQLSTIERPVGPVRPAAHPAAHPAADGAAVPVRKTTGRLQITSQPPVARVLVDGKFRGVTPLTLDDLKLGEHSVVLKTAEGSVSRTVTIAASDSVVLEEMIFSGWLAVYSPFDLVVREGAKALPLDDRHQIMLPPGPHAVHLENRALGYDEVRQVDLKPGEVLTLQVTPPRSALSVQATADAQVFVDGVLAGDTPLVAFPVALGTHEVIVKRAGDGRRFVVTSTVKPAALSVDFSKPAA